MAATPLAAMAIAALALSGCAGFKPVALPPAGPAYAAPQAWAGADGLRGVPGKLEAWWLRLGDPLLDELIQQALAGNASVAAARAALLQAQGARDAAAAGLGAEVQLSARAQRSKSGALAAAGETRAGLVAGWSPDMAGAQGHALAAAEADFEAAAAALAAARLAVAAELARDYIELRAVQVRRAVAQANLASLQDMLQITAWRVRAGLLTSLELQQAAGAVDMAAAQLAAFDAAAAPLRHSIGVLCGQAPGALAAALAPGPGIPHTGAAPIPEPPAAVLRQRPDVRAAEWQLAAARARVGQADAARYPALRLEGTLGLSGLGTGGSGGGLLRALLGSLTGTALDSGASQARLTQQYGALARAQAAYAAVLLGALREVEDALAALAGEQRRAAHFGLAGSTAANAALLARQRYASGLADYQAVLETQRALYAAQDGLALASSGAATALVRLAGALGGGWQPGAAPDLERP